MDKGALVKTGHNLCYPIINKSSSYSFFWNSQIDIRSVSLLLWKHFQGEILPLSNYYNLKARLRKTSSLSGIKYFDAQTWHSSSIQQVSSRQLLEPGALFQTAFTDATVATLRAEVCLGKAAEQLNSSGSHSHTPQLLASCPATSSWRMFSVLSFLLTVYLRSAGVCNIFICM